MDWVVVTIRHVFPSVLGLCYMQVCTVEDATDEEILAVCNRDNPAGTNNGWTEVVRENDPDEALRPGQCMEYPGRKHFLVRC